MNGFAAQVNLFGGRTMDKIERFRKAVVLSLGKSIILDTPVLSGRLRGNWQTTVDAPAGGTIERLDKEGAEAINELLSNMGDGTVTDVEVYFVNNLPYAYRIEFEGWSHTKAPEGMVRKNFARITEIVERARREGRV